jgi:TolB-like protein/thioredoxin-like negative regulator of GroEL
MSEKPSFFSELKRRNVYKVAVAYAVVGWLLVQVATQVFPFFEIPNWGVRLIVLAIVIGFPIALIIAWAFESTPQGIKPTEVADAAGQRSRGKAWIYVVVIGAALSIGLFFLGRYTATTKQRAGPIATEKSIAVLPFENLSDDKGAAYFADGIQDEILTKLASIADLKVISRTSTAKYKSKPEDLKTVSQQLGVATVLEGSVQKAVDKVRVNVQLIDARADSHLWAKTYDRDIKDVFAVESEVAQEIADSLQAKLSPAEAKTIATAPTTNSGAYDLFLKAESEFHNAQTSLHPESFQQAAAWYEQAIARDPNFALAIARLAECRLNIHWFIEPLQDAELVQVRRNVDRALALAPDLAEAHVTLGLFHYFVHRAYSEALAEFARAIELQPNNSPALQYSGYVHRRQGQWKQALDELNRSLKQDPRDPSLAGNLANTYNILRLPDEAQRMAKRAISIDPHETVGMVAWIYSILTGSGDVEEAQRVLATFPTDTKLTTNLTVPDFAALIGYRAYTLVVARKFDLALHVWDDSADQRRQLAAKVAIRVVAGDPTGARPDAQTALPLLEQRLQERPDETATMTELAWVYLALQRNEDAVRIAHRAVDVLPPSKDVLAGGGLLVGLAEVNAHCGMAADAINILHQQLSAPTGGPVSIHLLKIDPMWDPIRNDPAFQQLLTVKEHVGP